MVKTAPTNTKEIKMKLKSLTAAVLLASISLVSATTVMSQPNRNTNSRSPGFWQPKTQVNVNRPIAVILLNESGLPISYSLSPNPDRVLAPGSTTQVNVRIGNQARDIASINAYAAKELVYDYNVNPTNNAVMVRIRQSDSTFRADKAVYIDEEGRVYSF